MTSKILLIALCLFALSTCQSYRPAYHFLPEQNWMNDPNGPMYWNGIYHLFYQYNPFGDQWGNMHWGHAASDDLVHWKYLPIALYPDKLYDEGGVFSGSITLTDKGPMILYTGVNPEVQCIALPTEIDDLYLVNWTKIASNPVIPNPPPGLNVNGFRDPTTAWTGIDGFYYILVGSGVSGYGGAVLLYQSPDMYTWTYVHEFATEEGTFISPGNTWECPDFYPFGDSYLFKYSSISERADTWNIGVYNEEEMTWTTSTKGLYDYGIGAYYASKSFWDPSTSRRILWGWVTENYNWISQGWAGIQTLPRVVTQGDDGLPRFAVAQEIETLRDVTVIVKGVSVDNKVYSVPNVIGNQLELLVNISRYNLTSSFGLNIAVSPSRSETTGLTFMPATGPMNNTDLPGGDYFGFELETADPQLCEIACDEDNFCMAWTFTRPGLKGPSAWCFLKQLVPAQNANEECVSGIKSVMQVNRTLSSLTNPVNVNPILYAPYDANAILQLRIFIDNSIVEIFINNGKYCLTSRIYPSTPGTQQHVEFFAYGGSANFEAQVYTLNSVW